MSFVPGATPPALGNNPGTFAPQIMGPPAGAGPASFAPHVMGAPPAPGAGPASFAPQVMGPPAGPTSFAPQVMGPPAGAGPASFAPQVMGPPQAGFAPPPPTSQPGFVPQVMGVPQGGFGAQGLAPPPADPAASGGGATPGQHNATPLVTPRAALPFDPALPFVQQAAQPAPTAPSDPAMAMPPPPAMGAPMGPPPGADGAGTADPGLAASPWNRGNTGLDRDLLPSAMLAPSPEPAPASKRPLHAAARVPDAPSRAPWIIVGVLVIVAVAGGIVALQIRARRAAEGPIAVPAGGATATDDTPADTAAATAQPTASARPAPVVRPVRPRAASDDPYADVPVAPSKPKPATAPHRVFGTEN
jgi:hypothetical protein